MQSNTFFPRSTRNRLAMVMGLISLAIFITWNIMPTPFDPMFSIPGEELSIVAIDTWPQVILSFYYFNTLPFDRNSVIYMIGNLTLVMLAIFTLIVLPAQKLWQALKPLRVIAALLLLSCFAIWCNLLIEDPNPQYFLMHILITLNFLTTAIALLLFKNESLDVPHAV
jgi:hypothetical protein